MVSLFNELWTMNFNEMSCLGCVKKEQEHVDLIALAWLVLGRASYSCRLTRITCGGAHIAKLCILNIAPAHYVRFSLKEAVKITYRDTVQAVVFSKCTSSLFWFPGNCDKRVLFFESHWHVSVMQKLPFGSGLVRLGCKFQVQIPNRRWTLWLRNHIRRLIQPPNVALVGL